MEGKTAKRIALAGFVLLLFACFFYFDLGQFLTLSYLKQSQQRFALLYEQHAALVIAVYMLIYIVSTSLSVPGATVLTLAGGAMFGLGVGTVVVSFASTIGATLACLVSRYLLRDWVQNKLGERLQAVNAGIEREGRFYLFTLRLVPIFPFWAINLAMGLTRMELPSFFWVSQLGMLPATVVYVNAGKELAKIDSLGGILSPSLLISFVLLGLFPLIVKKVLSLFKRSKSIPNPK